MPAFKVVNNIHEIALNHRWVPATKFNSKDRVVDEKGDKVSSDYKGRRYRIIEKRERTFSTFERMRRGLMGILEVVSTLCLALFSKSVRNLFTKSKENMRFAVLEEQTRFKLEEGRVIYLEPKLLFEGTKISEDQELNIAVVRRDGKQKLIPVTNAKFGREYKIYEGSVREALLKIAQQEPHYCFSFDRHYGSPIGHFLKHANNSTLTEEEFFKFILEKDEAGTPRICTLNSASTLEALDIIKEKNLPINLNDKTSEGKTLFTLWAGKGNADITRLMLELDPSVIDQAQGQINSAFVEAALNGSKEEADLLLDAMGKKGIILSPEEVWIRRAFQNDSSFSEEEFINLEEELKIKVFFVANAFANEDIVKKLKPLGMDTVPLFWPGPSILANNMDIITTKNIVEGFLKGLRKGGLLLTAEEFNKLDKSKYISKIDQIGRIQGKNFIENLVQENGLKYIKVPKKIAVINEGVKSISFSVASSLELIPQEDQLTIYAERVKPVSRKLSLEEAIEFMIILEKTGYNDFFGRNFFFAEDGIYFIDTEYKDFVPTRPQWGSIKTIKNLVDPKDAEEFLAEYEKRKEAYDKEKESREAQQKKYRAAFENPYTRLTTGYAGHGFAFQLCSLA
ncbi:hypothetical protein DB41_DL00040 [Neochlamydia sp. TUME1]|uniref:hypothetical protein n=1 Tax=Neochlamydia sp. TUME1 TaxID=1478174 RepID=UPI00057D4DBB|nr:hypothetical protein [Neochlamydia sp. TUME1]KIC77026.1 hypothetical protein DB41_DL00040 [Neochlamydia sp. TUME1]